MSLRTPQGVDYQLTLTNTGEAVLLQGTLSALALTECARCLEEAQVDVEAEVQGYFLLDSADLDAGYEADEVDVVSPEGDIDLGPALQAALCFGTPSVVLCKEDCKGLCPKCGCDLNVESCTCADEPDMDNPFAALLGLSFDEEDVARGKAAMAEHAGDTPLSFDDDEPQLTPQEEAELEKALDAIFCNDAEGVLEFDDQGNLVFIPSDEDGEEG